MFLSLHHFPIINYKSFMKEKYFGYIYFIYRIGTALLFASHGVQKLFGEMGGHKATGTKFIIAGILEFFGGLFIAAGIKTRYVATVLVLEMFYAYFFVHAGRGVWPIENGGELAALYLFSFLLMMSLGSGIWSVDSLLAKRKKR